MRAARERKGWTQQDLAAQTGFQPAAISHFETGTRRPSFENLRRLALALGVTADHLLTLDAVAAAPSVPQDAALAYSAGHADGYAAAVRDREASAPQGGPADESNPPPGYRVVDNGAHAWAPQRWRWQRPGERNPWGPTREEAVRRAWEDFRMLAAALAASPPQEPDALLLDLAGHVHATEPLRAQPGPDVVIAPPLPPLGDEEMGRRVAAVLAQPKASDGEAIGPECFGGEDFPAVTPEPSAGLAEWATHHARTLTAAGDEQADALVVGLVQRNPVPRRKLAAPGRSGAIMTAASNVWDADEPGEVGP